MLKMTSLEAEAEAAVSAPVEAPRNLVVVVAAVIGSLAWRVGADCGDGERRAASSGDQDRGLIAPNEMRNLVHNRETCNTCRVVNTMRYILIHVHNIYGTH